MSDQKCGGSDPGRGDVFKVGALPVEIICTENLPASRVIKKISPNLPDQNLFMTVVVLSFTSRFAIQLVNFTFYCLFVYLLRSMPLFIDETKGL